MKDSQMQLRISGRESLRIPVKLELREENDSSARTLLGYTLNFSRHGLGMNVVSDKAIEKNADIIVNIDSENAFPSFKVPAKLVWHSNSQCGLKFLNELEHIQELIQKSTAHLEVKNPNLKKFYPYVGGEEVDTKKYEFLPYADKFITDFKKVREYMHQLKRGQSPSDAESYIYAQYAIADSHLNHVAVRSAHKAFLEFRNFSLERRRKILDDIRELLIKEKENLLELMKISVSILFKLRAVSFLLSNTRTL